MRKNLRWVYLVFVILSVATFSACGNGQGNQSQSSEPQKSAETQKPAETAKPELSNEPVSLLVGIPAWGKNEFETLKAAAKKRYPNITLESIDVGGGQNYEQNVIAKGIKPDILVSGADHWWMEALKQTGLGIDLAPIIKKSNYDLSKINQAILKVTTDEDHKIYSLPIVQNINVLNYNKDLFDKFAVVYPKDGMTWTELRGIATKLSRESQGVQYRGLEPGQIDTIASTLSLGVINPSTGKSIINSDGWIHVFKDIQSIYQIPGNENLTWFAQMIDQFYKNQTLAMYAGTIGFNDNRDSKVNWDVVTYPTFEENRGIGPTASGRSIAITPYSKNSDWAFKLVELMLSEEVQTQLSAVGSAPVIESKNAQQALWSSEPALKEKNLKAVFALKPANPAPVSKHDDVTTPIIRTEFQKMIKENTDANTTLRQVEELINQKVASLTK